MRLLLDESQSATMGDGRRASSTCVMRTCEGHGTMRCQEPNRTHKLLQMYRCCKYGDTSHGTTQSLEQWQKSGVFLAKVVCCLRTPIVKTNAARPCRSACTVVKDRSRPGDVMYRPCPVTQRILASKKTPM